MYVLTQTTLVSFIYRFAVHREMNARRHTYFYLMSDIKMSSLGRKREERESGEERRGEKGRSRGCLTPPGRIPVQLNQYVVIDLNHVKRIIA